ncbi:hypothetical protein GF361_00965 [Candidatus Woesearchaeota archaeon]|nr:hypothetical protein [Candidatus Woesearchaeota archaeon]
MAKKKKGDAKKTGHYSFIAGIVLAVLIALVPQLRGDISVWILVILGVIVGLLNVTAKETTGFLVASMALIIASSASALTLATIWTGLTSILGNIIVFVSPAAIVVALKTVYSLAEN